MVTFNIEKKNIYLLAAIMVFLVGTGIVIAYTQGDDTANPAVMGHTADEIEGLTEFVQGIVFGTQDDCSGTDLIFTSWSIPVGSDPWKHKMTSANYHLGTVDVPSECIDKTCVIKQEIFYKGNPKLLVFYTYFQDGPLNTDTGIWASSYYAKGKKNGDTSTSSFMKTYNYLYARDDYDGISGAEGIDFEKNKWTFLDKSSSYDMIVSICTEIPEDELPPPPEEETE